MSNEAINWAYKQALPSGEKFVIVALADFADHEWSCFPSQERLAQMTGQGVRTVRRHLDRLEEVGLISRESRRGKGGQRTSDRYYLQAAKMAGSEQEPTGQIMQNQPAKLAGEPLVEPPVEEMPTSTVGDVLLVDATPALDPNRPAPKTTPVALLDEEFASSWWSTYPRKVAKETARRAYRMARRKASLDDLLAGVEAYVRNKPDWADYAYPASWLNGGRWADEHETAPATSARTEPLPMPDVDPDDVTAWVAAMEARRG